LLSEAEDVLKRFNGENPFFAYYLGYLADINGNSDQAQQFFKSAAGKSVDYVFPYRLESVNVLNTAIKYNPTDGKAYYYLGNILYEKQPDAAIMHWKNAIKLNPELAIAYRNLGWGYFYHLNNVPEAITHYEKAIALNRNEALYFTELSELYETNNTPIETRIKLFEGNTEIAKNRDDSYMYYIENLILSKQAKRAVEALEGANFAYTEGSSRSRNIRINANLMLGKQYYDNKEYQKALDTFLKAKITKQEAGDDRLGGREVEVDYYIGLAYEALGKRSKANESFRSSANQPSQTVNVTSYYQGLSFAKLGKNDQAKKIFESLVSEADQQMKQSMDSEVGAIFGRREAADNRLSRLYTMRGLGYKGLGNLEKAKDDLNKALELSQSNLTAIIEEL
jgi:tetratricopeptide (TPR) repeat protein